MDSWVAVVTERGVDVGSLVVARLGASYRLARAILLDDHEAEDAIEGARRSSAWASGHPVTGNRLDTGHSC